MIVIRVYTYVLPEVVKNNWITIVFGDMELQSGFWFGLTT